jgi:hypothetical protein
MLALAGRREVRRRDHLQPVVLPVARDDPDWLPAQAQTLRDDAYAAGCDPTIVPPPTG